MRAWLHNGTKESKVIDHLFKMLGKQPFILKAGKGKESAIYPAFPV